MKTTASKNKTAGSGQQESDFPKIAQPALRALAGAGIRRLEQLTSFSEEEIRQLHGMGPKALGQLRQALADKGLSFAAEKKGNPMKKTASKNNLTPSEHIDNHINELGDWRGKTLARLRKVILDASPELTEEWKWDTPVWVHQGNVLAGGVFKDHVKLNFFQGASLADPRGLFNAGLEAKTSRGIDFHEGSKIDEPALKELIRAAVAHNTSGGKKK